MFPLTGLTKTDMAEAAWAFYMDGTMSIEILKNDELQKIYFRVKDKVTIRFVVVLRYKQYILSYRTVFMQQYIMHTPTLCVYDVTERAA